MEDIFSFDKIKKEPNQNTIIVDSREKNSLVLSYLREKNAKCEIKKLDVGDYIIGEVIIERKTFHDLIHSIKTNRLKEQIKNLKQYEKKVLILEKDPRIEVHSQIHPNTINGTVIALTIHHNIPIIYTTSERHTAQILLQISTNEKKEQPIQTKKIPKTYNEKRQFILESFPGIGPKHAKELIENFNSLKEIFNSKDKNEILPEKINKEFNDLLE